MAPETDEAEVEWRREADDAWHVRVAWGRRRVVCSGHAKARACPGQAPQLFALG